MNEEFKLTMTLVPKFDTEALASAMNGIYETAGAGGNGRGDNGGPGGNGGGQGGNGGTVAGRQAASTHTSEAGDDASNGDTSEAMENARKRSRFFDRFRIMPRKDEDSDNSDDGEKSEKRIKALTKVVTTGVSLATKGLQGIASMSLGFIEDMYRRMRDASPLLQSVEALFNLAVTLFFMPLGNKLGEILIPATVELLDKVVDLWDAFEGKTLGEAIQYAIEKGTQIFGEYISGIGETLSNQSGVVGTIGRFMVKIGDWVENRMEGFIEAILNVASWIMDNFKAFVSLYVGLQTATLGAIIGGSSLLGNITGPWGALAGAGLGFGIGSLSTAAVLTDYGFAEGGYIPARDGGSWALVGEGGQGEYIIPESKLQNIASSNNSVTNNFYGYTNDDVVRIVRDEISSQISLSKIKGGF